ncbi:hypothetical protein PBI_VALIDUS_62 [Mycobacterium phage Validus]|uniref:Uncharacterized protein n=1 Tax=Mycobacterium phage Validus TaxID=1414747 RepID=V5URN3_9CAUD|nr:hypothetical protein CC50_gp049 [Mycobacterium phage Validus]AHB79592.1 hypothetical protein PBI_VALIDUS_62 [Mycobacterium phage Validus]
MSAEVVIGRVFVGDAPPPELRATRASAVVYVIPASGEVRLQASSAGVAVTAEQSRQIAELMAAAHKAAPSIAAAYNTRERARKTAEATYQRLVRNAIRGAVR